MQPSKPKILIADDDADVLAVLGAACRDAPFVLSSSPDGDEALRLYHEALSSGEPFRGVILDVVMHRLSGYAVATTIRETDKATLLAFHTAHVNDLWRGWARDLGVTAIWQKPIDPAQLCLSISRWMDGQRINVDQQ